MILQFMTMLQVVMLKRTYSGKYYTYVMRLLLKKKVSSLKKVFLSRIHIGYDCLDVS